MFTGAGRALREVLLEPIGAGRESRFPKQRIDRADGVGARARALFEERWNEHIRDQG
jgi:hypothetical protein